MAHDNSDDNSFESRLNDGTDRFLAHVLEHAFAIGRRTSVDFLRHFPPASIMEALKELPALRADILEAATGVRRKIALKKNAESSGQDLQIALDEGEAAPDEVIHLFRPDDRVRYLPRRALWTFLIEGEFWKVNKTDKSNFERSAQHIAFILDRAVKDRVLSYQEIIEGISIGKLSQLLPRSELEMALDSALAAGRNGQPFSDQDFYENLTSVTITTHVPLSHIWDQVIHPCIALSHDLIDSAALSGDGAPKVVDQGGPITARSSDPPPANSNEEADLGPTPRTGPDPAQPPAPSGARVSQQPPVPSPAGASRRRPAAAQPPSEALELKDEVAFDLDFEDEVSSGGSGGGH